MADSRSRLAKIRTLAERGATEGERNAAREALRRLEASGVTEETPEEKLLITLRGYNSSVRNATTASDAITIILNDLMWTFAQSQAPRHGGRVWFDVG